MAPARASSDDPHEIKYFKRRSEDDPNESVLGREFMRSCPVQVRAKFDAVLVAVAKAPPKRFSGGGYWEAMRGMPGHFEIRVDGPERRHYRLFCVLDYDGEGQDKPLLVILDGDSKAFRTTFPERRYDEVKELGVEYFKKRKRPLV